MPPHKSTRDGRRLAISEGPTQQSIGKGNKHFVQSRADILDLALKQMATQPTKQQHQQDSLPWQQESRPHSIIPIHSNSQCPGTSHRPSMASLQVMSNNYHDRTQNPNCNCDSSNGIEDGDRRRSNNCPLPTHHKYHPMRTPASYRARAMPENTCCNDEQLPRPDQARVQLSDESDSLPKTQLRL